MVESLVPAAVRGRVLTAHTTPNPTSVAHSVSESVHVAANGPSMGLYRLQQHVERSVPALAADKRDLRRIQSSVDGTTRDLDFAVE